MTTYTDPKLLDVAGALDVLPNLPLDGSPDADRELATGTDGSGLALWLALNTDNRCKSGSIADKTMSRRVAGDENGAVAVSACYDKSKGPSTTAVNESCRWAMTDLNRRLPPCKGGALAN